MTDIAELTIADRLIDEIAVVKLGALRRSNDRGGRFYLSGQVYGIPVGIEAGPSSMYLSYRRGGGGPFRFASITPRWARRNLGEHYTPDEIPVAVWDSRTESHAPGATAAERAEFMRALAARKLRRAS